MHSTLETDQVDAAFLAYVALGVPCADGKTRVTQPGIRPLAGWDSQPRGKAPRLRERRSSLKADLAGADDPRDHFIRAYRDTL